jgi:diaminopimelate decarboxylase
MLELHDNTYTLQNIPLTDLAEKYGLPLYIYDADTMKRQFDNLNKAFSGLNMKVKYACKALNNLAILSMFRA